MSLSLYCSCLVSTSCQRTAIIHQRIEMVINITIGIIVKLIVNIAVIVITVMRILNIAVIVIIAKLTVGDLKERMEASFLSKQLA